MKKLKVWGGSWDGRHRAIVAAYTKKQAMELINSPRYRFSRHYFDGYWCETGNHIELLVGIVPGVWICKDKIHAESSKDFVPVGMGL